MRGEESGLEIQTLPTKTVRDLEKNNAGDDIMKWNIYIWVTVDLTKRKENVTVN